ncbi:Bis(5'-nucleosyl)-tetraphosphatase PrpE [asymmetrical] [Pirellulimonas nuda]|uniref:Bis(5'-nucleosyl)-tetraphosphatase PrpE [asymmetrical] n=2 Tax=Pirellulimonas nuda TaxID=2528009 RepID=A0A518D5P0_9BACT|nr:Bis(5'-nucleosyl)-tetraphosphatase PrpE [asymmetrical] [Pirellulimonas nuda]
MYDIIGDIHGHAAHLEALLDKLGYRCDGAGYAHDGRQAVFVGDFIDRGPAIRQALAIVRAMVDSGAALATMGNHEFNALAYHTPAPGRPGEFLRAHNDKNTHQHAATLKQIEGAERADMLAWFRTLPLWLDLGRVRVVHACWDPAGIKTLEAGLGRYGGVSDGFMAEATSQGTALFNAVEHVLKGPEAPLPAGMTYDDKDGHARRRSRVRWFLDPVGLTFGQYALPALELVDDQPAGMVPAVELYPASAPPVFFGHYWMTGDPKLMSPNAACVDYSVAKGGPLCAYRWQGEAELRNDRFVTVAIAKE